MFLGIGMGMVGGGVQTSVQSLLFAQNEPGFMFTPQDITTLYQDRAGTTPVTAVGQSVGLRLSKDQGLRQGPERGAALTFAGWTVSSGVTVSGGVATFSSAAQNSNAYNVVGTVEAGKTYRVSLTVSSYVSGTAALLLPGGSGRGAITSNGTFTGVYTAGSTGVIYLWAQGASNNTFVISNYSVRELAGNHEVAINDAARGVYGREPKGGTRNALRYTEQFDNAAWTKSGSTISANAVAGPDGATTADKLVETATTSEHLVSAVNIGSGQKTASIYFKAAERTQAAIYFYNATNGVVASYFDLSSGTVISGAGVIETVGGGWYRCSLTRTATVNDNVYFCAAVGGNTTYLGSTSSGIYIWGAQLELGSTATAYQRVVSQYDVTEAGVASCYYVQTDGVDDAYVTPTITPGTDKAQVFAGLRKNSDVDGAVLLEHSASINSNAGSFGIYPQGTGTDAAYTFGSRGSALSGANFAIATPYNAPTYNVIACLGDISGDRAALRVNGVQVAQSTADQGTGNYLAYPAYIYARGGTMSPFNGRDYGHAGRFGPTLDAATIALVEALIARNTPEVPL